jgi:hypothetical protein
MTDLHQAEDARSIGNALDHVREALELIEAQLAEVQMHQIWGRSLFEKLERGALVPWTFDDAEKQRLLEARRFIKAVVR